MKIFFKTTVFTFVLLCLINCKGNETQKKLEKQQRDPDITSIHNDSIMEQKKKTLDSSLAMGKEVYTQNCAVCHQPTGTGVPNMNPPLSGADLVIGDKQKLIGIVLNGSTQGDINPDYSNNMPAFNSLEDSQIANVLSYIRNSFGNNAGKIKASEVKKVRKEID